MKVLKALLVTLTALAVAATALLLFCQAKNAPHYIHIYGGEEGGEALAAPRYRVPNPKRACRFAAAGPCFVLTVWRAANTAPAGGRRR